jgi:hypothetical protein
MVKRTVFLCVMGLALTSDAGERLTMRVSPKMSLEPALVTVRTVIEADAGNRLLEVVADSPEFYRSSSIQLDGANAPRLNVVELKNLPTGTYEVTSVLVGAGGQRTAVSQVVRVAPSPGFSR